MKPELSAIYQSKPVQTFTLLLFAFTIAACSSQQLQQGMSQVLSGMNGQSQTVDSNQAALGLKEALKKGANAASTQLAKQDGFFKNQAIKILIPEEFQKVEKTIRQVGLGSLADQAILSFNRAAEKASSKAYPILATAVTEMTFADAMNILLGKSNEATVYLKSKTTAPLQKAFLPVVKESADQVSATKYWGKMAGYYNKIPFNENIPTDISQYITNKTLDGLFHRIEKEEIEIRKNPVARTSELLKRVFGFADKKK